MKKLIFIFIILCSIFFIKDVEAKNTFCYTIGTTTYCIDSVVIAASDCSTYIESGVLCRDTDNDTVYVGNGTAAVAISGSSSGDVQSAGDCLGGACYDGSSDGGTYVRLYDGDSNYTAIVPSNTSSNVTITLPATTGTLLGSGAAVTPAQGGTGVANGTNNTITFTGNYSFGATLTGSTAVTFPTSGTLAILGGNVWTGVHDFGGATSVEIPNGASPTVDAAGEIAIDTTSDQLIYYGGAKQVLSPKMFFSIVIPSVADTDDMLIMKAPYGMVITAINCIVSAATSATINIQECNSTGGSCVDMASSDLVCSTSGASTTTFVDAPNPALIDSGDWIKLDIPSISGTPRILTVTVSYTIAAD